MTTQAERLVAIAAAGAVVGTVTGMTIHGLTGYATVWSYVLLDLAGMLATAGAVDVVRGRRR